MAQFTATISEGAESGSVAFAGTGSSSTSVSVVVDKAKIQEPNNAGKAAVIRCLKRIIKAIEENAYPPA